MFGVGAGFVLGGEVSGIGVCVSGVWGYAAWVRVGVKFFLGGGGRVWVFRTRFWSSFRYLRLCFGFFI